MTLVSFFLLFAFLAKQAAIPCLPAQLFVPLFAAIFLAASSVMCYTIAHLLNAP